MTPEAIIAAASIAADSSISHLNLPVYWPPGGSLTRDWVDNLAAAFDWSSRNLPPNELPSVIPYEVLLKLIVTASNILHQEPNCVQIVPPTGDEAGGSRVVVVGDVHGQLHDVLFLLREAGFPSEERIFVFNGDYVDRGAWGLETFLLLLAWKVFLPDRVFLLRGNHETKYCTSVYGFEKEVKTKFEIHGQQVYNKCLRCFGGLPLATIIASSVYTAHGGLFRSNLGNNLPRNLRGKKGRKKKNFISDGTLKVGTLEELSKARRTILDPSSEESNHITGDVLWSDPSSSMGLSPNEERGIGLLWGPDCSESFLSKYQLKLIIRSHEGPDARYKRHDMKDMQDGYTVDHEVDSGKLITLFSAPDYPQFQANDARYNNRGAYIILKPPDFATPEFHTFEATRPRPQVNAYYNFCEVMDSDEELDLESMDHRSVDNF